MKGRGLIASAILVAGRGRAQEPFLPRSASEWKDDDFRDAYAGNAYLRTWEEFFVHHKSYAIDNESKKEKSTKENI